MHLTLSPPGSPWPCAGTRFGQDFVRIPKNVRDRPTHTAARVTVIRVIHPRALTVLLTSTLALAACSGAGSEPSPSATSPDAPVLQPGTPGEPNSSLSGTDAVATPSDAHNAADVAFLEDMIGHHAQAIVMGELVEGDLEDEKVRSLAARISDEQEPEMRAMGQVLESWGTKAPPQAENPTFGMNSGHGHSMPGMASRAELDDLEAATGREADRLYLDLMITHHEGAIEMCTTLGEQGEAVRTEEMCDDITVTQAKQISQMKAMRTRL